MGIYSYLYVNRWDHQGFMYFKLVNWQNTFGIKYSPFSKMYPWKITCIFVDLNGSCVTFLPTFSFIWFIDTWLRLPAYCLVLSPRSVSPVSLLFSFGCCARFKVSCLPNKPNTFCTRTALLASILSRFISSLFPHKQHFSVHTQRLIYSICNEALLVLIQSYRCFGFKWNWIVHNNNNNKTHRHTQLEKLATM